MPSTASSTQIEVRDAYVHNLKGLNIDIPHGQWLAVCGPSGSGKTSLALDTLYAEGQRRYIESFSAYTRQFLNAMEKPNAREINGIPPAIAVTRARRSMTGRATVGSTTETLDYLREVFAKLAQPVCAHCNLVAKRNSSDEIVSRIDSLQPDNRLIIGFSWVGPRSSLQQTARHLLLAGFARASIAGETADLAQVAAGDGLQTGEEETVHSELPVTMALEELGWQSAINPAELLKRFPTGSISLAARVQEGQANSKTKNRKSKKGARGKKKSSKTSKSISYDKPVASGNVCLDVVVDRVVSGKTERSRLVESIETALSFGERTFIWCDSTDESPRDDFPPSQPCRCLGRDGIRWNFSQQLECAGCNQEFPFATPALFSYNSPAGACPTCEGFGSVSRPDLKLIVPDPRKTIRHGAIATWFTPKYKVKLRKLISIASEVGLDVDKPFEELTDDELEIIWEGSSAHRFVGINGFFRWLDKKKYKMHHRIFAARWRSYFDCPTCNGLRLKATALQYKIQDQSIADICEMKVADSIKWFENLPLEKTQKAAVRTVLPQVVNRLNYLADVGLAYLTLDRTLRTLSGGELQRTSLTTALGSSLVNMLYVLDEPSVGLHPRDIQRLTDAIGRLNAGGNTVVTVEHEPAMLVAAQRIVEIGPGAGASGGEVVFDGTFRELQKNKSAVTSRFVQHLTVSGRAKKAVKAAAFQRRKPSGWIHLNGATGHNLRNATVKIPTGVMCLITGVSGSGKSSLIRQTLHPAMVAEMADEIYNGLPYRSLKIPKSVGEVILIDDSPIGRSPRSNPVTYVKAFDPIRKMFAATVDAKSKNLMAGAFSFNVDGGRCTKCQGDGTLSIDMQFMPDVYMQCPECQGTRYQKEILEVTVRDRNIHEVLQLTVREAFQFFRGETPILSKLQPLVDVGLDYIQLGQGAPTLSAGESQRLKLASYLGTNRKKQTLFILDEPSTGLHPTDIEKLIECFGALLDVGHSLVVIEHNTQLMSAADYIVDLGPEAADGGGTIVAAGAPEEIVQIEDSITGQYLATELYHYQ